MKIRCPLCEIIFEKEIPMFNHISIYHNWMGLWSYVNLIFKINKKIQSLQKTTKGSVFENSYIEEELKSVLENEK